MRMNFKLLLAFGVGFIATAGATLAQSYGRGRNVAFVDGTAISPSSVTTSGAITGDTLTATTTSADAVYLNSGRPICMNAPTCNAASRIFYNGSAIQAGGGLVATTVNSSTASGNNAYTCTNVGCRLSLGNTARYFSDTGSWLRTQGFLESSSGFLSRYFQATTTPVEMGTLMSVGTEKKPIRFYTGNAFTADDVDLITAYNSTSEVMTFSKDGLLRVNKSNAAKPTCNADNRGRIYYLDGAAGVPDTYEVCSKNAADAYAWVQVGFSSENASAPMTLTSNTPNSVTSGTVPAIRAQTSQALTNSDLLFAVTNSAGTNRFAVREDGAIPTSHIFTNQQIMNAGFVIGTALWRRESSTITIPDSGGAGAAAFTWTPGIAASSVRFTCNDADGCDVTVGEGTVLDSITVMAINVGTNVINFTDTAGVSELAGNFAMGQWDILELLYVTDRYIEIRRSNN